VWLAELQVTCVCDCGEGRTGRAHAEGADGWAGAVAAGLDGAEGDWPQGACERCHFCCVVRLLWRERLERELEASDVRYDDWEAWQVTVGDNTELSQVGGRQQQCCLCGNMVLWCCIRE
jgi:hypothetical protein